MMDNQQGVPLAIPLALGPPPPPAAVPAQPVPPTQPAPAFSSFGAHSHTRCSSATSKNTSGSVHDVMQPAALSLSTSLISKDASPPACSSSTAAALAAAAAAFFTGNLALPPPPESAAAMAAARLHQQMQHAQQQQQPTPQHYSVFTSKTAAAPHFKANSSSSCESGLPQPQSLPLPLSLSLPTQPAAQSSSAMHEAVVMPSGYSNAAAMSAASRFLLNNLFERHRSGSNSSSSKEPRIFSAASYTSGGNSATSGSSGSFNAPHNSSHLLTFPPQFGSPFPMIPPLPASLFASAQSSVMSINCPGNSTASGPAEFGSADASLLHGALPPPYASQPAPPPPPSSLSSQPAVHSLFNGGQQRRAACASTTALLQHHPLTLLNQRAHTTANRAGSISESHQCSSIADSNLTNSNATATATATATAHTRTRTPANTNHAQSSNRSSNSSSSASSIPTHSPATPPGPPPQNNPLLSQLLLSAQHAADPPITDFMETNSADTSHVMHTSVSAMSALPADARCASSCRRQYDASGLPVKFCCPICREEVVDTALEQHLQEELSSLRRTCARQQLSPRTANKEASASIDHTSNFMTDFSCSRYALLLQIRKNRVQRKSLITWHRKKDATQTSPNTTMQHLFNDAVSANSQVSPKMVEPAAKSLISSPNQLEMDTKNLEMINITN